MPHDAMASFCHGTFGGHGADLSRGLLKPRARLCLAGPRLDSSSGEPAQLPDDHRWVTGAADRVRQLLRRRRSPSPCSENSIGTITTAARATPPSTYGQNTAR